MAHKTTMQVSAISWRDSGASSKLFEKHQNDALCLPNMNTSCRTNPGKKGPELKTLLVNFLREDQGQDLVECTLILAFVCVASAVLFLQYCGSPRKS